MRIINSFLASGTVLTANTVPDAPTVTLTPGNGQVSIAWVDGATGGSPITAHRIYVNGAAMTPITSASPYVLTGLANGTAVSIQVSAINGIGEGSLSAAQSVTPSVGSVISASPRARLWERSDANTNVEGSVGSPLSRYTQTVHTAVVGGDSYQDVMWNGWVQCVAGNTAWEKANSAAIIWERAIVINPTISTTTNSRNQTGATVITITYAGLQAGTTLIKDLAFATRTWADFVAAGGAVGAGDGAATSRVTVPAGWSVQCDPVSHTFANGEKYLLRHRQDNIGGKSSLMPYSIGVVGDASRASSSAAVAGMMTALDWTTSTGWSDFPTGQTAYAPQPATTTYAFYAQMPVIATLVNRQGKRSAVWLGTSIPDGAGDTAGDMLGGRGMQRFLTATGYSTWNGSLFGSSIANIQGYAGDGYRTGCPSLLTQPAILGFYNNDGAGVGKVFPATAPGGAAATGSSDELATWRWYNLRLRAAFASGNTPRLVGVTIPKGAGTIFKGSSLVADGTTATYTIDNTDAPTAAAFAQLQVGDKIALGTGSAGTLYGGTAFTNQANWQAGAPATYNSTATSYGANTDVVVTAKGTNTFSFATTWNTTTTAVTTVPHWDTLRVNPQGGAIFTGADNQAGGNYDKANAYLMLTGAWASYTPSAAAGDFDATLDLLSFMPVTNGLWNAPSQPEYTATRAASARAVSPDGGHFGVDVELYMQRNPPIAKLAAAFGFAA